ncbi:MAG: tRNA1(Val) (adenine(37)-N6)-methyltransferase [Clostridia bacterium]|nr:tRNA1(Val) (adenine(37)-N6)-methyltransferase [Clostridia bacterium]
MANCGIALREGERLDDLQTSGYRLIQRPDAFRFGTDSVLLADFARPSKRDIAVDLGCGTGAIATLMAAHCPQLRLDAVELQEDIADMARRSAQLNGLEQRLRVHCMDMREAWRALGAGRYSLAVCNPPYGKRGGGLTSESETQRIARHEDSLAPWDIAKAASMLLKTGGRLCVVYPAPRAYEMMRAMEENHLAPKRVRTVHGVAGRAPKLVLLEGVRGGGEGLHWLEPLVLQNGDGSYTEEWKRIYRVSESPNAD